MIDQMIEIYTRAMTQETHGYLIVLAVTAGFAVVWRIATTPRRRAVTEPISTTELAFLRKETAPVVTALASLRASGRITGNRRVDRAVQAGPETEPFIGRMLARVTADPRHTVSGLLDATRGDLLVMERRLSERGLVRTRAERARMRWGTAPSVLVTLFGFGYSVYLLTRLINQRHLDHAVEFAMVLATTAVYATVVLPALLTVNRLTRAGRRLLEAEQGRLSYLRPAERPAFATYGPSAVALSVALFGTGALWAIDADYSTSVELAGGSSGATDAAGCGASCGGDGGSGCGGGGCGGCGGGCGG